MSHPLSSSQPGKHPNFGHHYGEQMKLSDSDALHANHADPSPFKRLRHHQQYHTQQRQDTLEKTSQGYRTEKDNSFWRQFKQHYQAMIGIAAGSVVLVLSGRYLREQLTKPSVAKILKAFHTSTSDWKKMIKECSSQDILNMSTEVCKRSQSRYVENMAGLSEIAEGAAQKVLGGTIIAFDKGRTRLQVVAHELLHAFQNKHRILTPFFSIIFNRSYRKAMFEVQSNFRSKLIRELSKKQTIYQQEIGPMLSNIGLGAFLKKQSTSTLKLMKLNFIVETVTHRNGLNHHKHLQYTPQDFKKDVFNLTFYRELTRVIRRELRRRGA